MLIGLVNESTVVDALSAQIIAHACGHQLRYDAAPLWEAHAPAVVYYPDLKSAPDNADIITIFDNADQQGALGYHDETPDGRPYGKIFAKTVLDNGGQVLTSSLSVSVTTSHEVLELFGDPNVNLWVDDGGGNEIAVELCDPVESQAYDVSIVVGGKRMPVPVSNFVTRAYFDKQASPISRFDLMNQLTAPWSMASGGYLIVRSAGDITQKFNHVAKGADGYWYAIEPGPELPDWKRDVKLNEAARTFKRLGGPITA